MDDVIHVLIIHGNRTLREAVALAIAQQPAMTVVRSVAEVGEVLGDLESLRPDVILLDVGLPGREGLGEARQIRRVFPEANILLMCLAKSESDVLAYIEPGVAGCLTQEASLEELLNNIQAVAAGEVLCSPKVTRRLWSRVADAGRERELRELPGLPILTRRELEIIALIEDGLSNKEIAVRLHIEVPTVKTHVHNILEKLQLDGRREAARYARERGLMVSVH